LETGVVPHSAGAVSGVDVGQDRQELDRAKAARRLGSADLEAAPSKVQIANQRVSHLDVARAREDERRDERVPPGRPRRGLMVERRRGVEQRGDLVYTVEMNRADLWGSQLAVARLTRTTEPSSAGSSAWLRARPVSGRPRGLPWLLQPKIVPSTGKQDDGEYLAIDTARLPAATSAATVSAHFA
jgi:hypothetical protein